MSRICSSLPSLAALAQSALPEFTEMDAPGNSLRSVARTCSSTASTSARPPFASMYYTFAQQLAHLTSNGASLRTGDLFASGTVSGPEPDAVGSLIERSWDGERPIPLPDGTTRTYLEDGDRVTLTGWAGGDGRPRVSLGEVVGTVGRPTARLPSRTQPEGPR